MTIIPTKFTPVQRFDYFLNIQWIHRNTMPNILQPKNSKFEMFCIFSGIFYPDAKSLYLIRDFNPVRYNKQFAELRIVHF